MNKKGFTLIEIIISLTIIIVISGTIIVSIFIKNKNEDKKIMEVTKKIQEAAAVYLSVNKDIDSTIENNIHKGGSGYVIPLKTLLEEGYISESYITTLEKNGVTVDDNDYMLAAAFSKVPNMCTNPEGTIEILPSYVPEFTEPYYLCNFAVEKNYLYYDLAGGKFNDNTVNVELYSNNTKVKLKDGSKVEKASDSKYEYIFDGFYKDKDFTTKFPVDSNNEFLLSKDTIIYAKYKTKEKEQKPTIIQVKDNIKYKVDLTKNAFVTNEKGIYTFIDYDTDVNKMYTYYRGAVDNNYVKLGKKDGVDLYWRILWMDENNLIKLILDEEIPLTISKKNGDIHTFTSGDQILQFKEYNIINPTMQTDMDRTKFDSYASMIYTNVYYNSNNLLNNMIQFTKNMIDSSNIYYKKLKEWYNKTNLDSYNFITDESNFCRNEYWLDNASTGSDIKYKQSNTFNCAYSTSYDGWGTPKYNTDNTKYSSPVGFITVGEAIRAGLVNEDKSVNIVDKNSFLLKNSNMAYPLVDIYSYYSYWYRGRVDDAIKFYYINNTGLTYGLFYQATREGKGSSGDYSRYTLINEAGEKIYTDVLNKNTDGMILYKSYMQANSVKPAIIIDLTNKKFEGDGTRSNSFTITDK